MHNHSGATGRVGGRASREFAACVGARAERCARQFNDRVHSVPAARSSIERGIGRRASVSATASGSATVELRLARFPDATEGSTAEDRWRSARAVTVGFTLTAPTLSNY